MRRKRIKHKRILAVLGIICAIVYFYVNLLIPGKMPGFLRIGITRRPINILALGTDITYDAVSHKPIPDIAGRTDTIMLVHVDPPRSRVSILSIPRDTYLFIPGYGMQKINAANVFGGIPLVKETVSHFTGEQIDGYIKIKPTTLTKLVDRLGGVTINIEKDMRYVDHAQGLDINLKQGRHKLSGIQAHNYIRFRNTPRGDIERIERQQKFMRAICISLVNPLKLLRTPSAIRTAIQEIETNLSPGQIARILNLTRMVKKENITTFSAPGEPFYTKEAGSVWLPDKESMKKQLAEFF